MRATCPPYIDGHNHQSNGSPDAVHSAAELVAEAQALGLRGITFTDHYDYDGRDDNAWCVDLAPYITWSQAVRQTTGSCLCLTGLELGYTPEHRDHLESLAHTAPLDAIVLSCHLFDGLAMGLYARYSHDHKRFVSDVIEALADAAQHVPSATTLGHYDYFSRYAPWPNRPFRYADAPAAFDRLFAVLRRNEQALELNGMTVIKLGQKGHGDDAWPDPEILRQYHAQGGRMVTIGSDAHRPGQLAHASEGLIARALRAKLSVVAFVDKKPIRAA